uniref:Uncharacterized protein n=1 Tax=Ciona savignyi TaxID=51511 RepID=H2YH30_CIOSA
MAVGGIHKQVVGGSESSDTSKVFTEHKGWLLEKYSKEKVIHHKNQRTAPATPFIAVIERITHHRNQKTGTSNTIYCCYR